MNVIGVDFTSSIQAAWAWTMRGHGYGAPRDADALEGWIADPSISGSAVRN